MGAVERKVYAIKFSNGWRHTASDEAAAEARARDLPVVEFVPADDYRGAVEALRTYGTHLPNCALRVEDDEDVSVECDCGYTAAIGERL